MSRMEVLRKATNAIIPRVRDIMHTPLLMLIRISCASSGGRYLVFDRTPLLIDSGV